MIKGGRPLAEMPDVLTVPEAAEVLRISRIMAYEAVRENRIPTIKFGRRILIPKAALARLLQEGTEGR